VCKNQQSADLAYLVRLHIDLRHLRVRLLVIVRLSFELPLTPCGLLLTFRVPAVSLRIRGCHSHSIDPKGLAISLTRNIPSSPQMTDQSLVLFRRPGYLDR
jgi:hypothetical protein